MYSLKMSATGEAKEQHSIRSSIPPCPGNNVPESLICTDRFKADSYRSPICPAVPMSRNMTIHDAQGSDGRNMALIIPPINRLALSPPIEPSMVFLGLTDGQSLWRPRYEPA